MTSLGNNQSNPGTCDAACHDDGKGSPRESEEDARDEESIREGKRIHHHLHPPTPKPRCPPIPPPPPAATQPSPTRHGRPDVRGEAAGRRAATGVGGGGAAEEGGRGGRAAGGCAGAAGRGAGGAGASQGPRRGAAAPPRGDVRQAPRAEAGGRRRARADPGDARAPPGAAATAAAGPRDVSRRIRSRRRRIFLRFLGTGRLVSLMACVAAAE